MRPQRVAAGILVLGSLFGLGLAALWGGFNPWTAGFFLVQLIAAIAAWRGDSAASLSLAVLQAPQVVFFTTPSLGWQCFTGVLFGLQFLPNAEDNLSLLAGFGSGLTYTWANPPSLTSYGVNIAAVVLLFLLVLNRRSSTAV